MSASPVATTSDFIALAQSMVQLRTLAGDLSSLAAFEEWMPNEDGESQFEQHDNRTKTAEIGSRLYLELARAAMGLVGRPYDSADETPLESAQSKNMLHQIGIDLSAAPSTIRVADVLPVIAEASQLMKLIALSVQPLMVRNDAGEDRRAAQRVLH